MPRQLRIDFPGAIHHVLSRGDRRENIYRDDVDRQDLLKTLAEACQQTEWQVHACCLMRNHFHLVVETPKANLVAGMHWLLSTYTMRLNRRHEPPGHVFSGRYKALVVESDGGGYLKTVCDYVHLNPVRAHLLGAQDRLLRYPWSSLVWYPSAPAHRPGWMRVDRLLGEHGIPQDTAAGRMEFEGRMEARRRQEEDEDQLQPLRRGWCLGSPEFRQRMLAQLEQRGGENPNAAVRRESAEAKAERMVAQELARLRRETLLPLKRIAARVGLGTSKGANRNLHAWMQQRGVQDIPS
jgi:REP element-mobilizing transposase RayT